MAKAPIKTTDPYRSAELAKIHIGKKDLNLSEETYDDIIFVASGNKSTSAADLDQRGRLRVLERYQELGWQSKPKKNAKPARRLAPEKQTKMLRALWIQLHQAGLVRDSSDKALYSFVKNMTGKDAWLDNRDVTVLKKALVEWLERGEEPEGGVNGKEA